MMKLKGIHLQQYTTRMNHAAPLTMPLSLQPLLRKAWRRDWKQAHLPWYGIIQSLHAFLSVDQVRCSRYHMAALHPALCWETSQHVYESPAIWFYGKLDHARSKQDAHQLPGLVLGLHSHGIPC